MWPYATWDDAIFDVLRLSKGMTYKSAVADTGLGGGKSVIIGNPKTDKTEALFRAMGRFVDALGGKYITAEDVGTSRRGHGQRPRGDEVRHRPAEGRWARAATRRRGPRSASSSASRPASRRSSVTGDFNGPHRRDPGLRPRRHVPRRAPARGRREAAPRRHLARARPGARRRDRRDRRRADGDRLEAECDVFAPCALGAVINDESLPTLNCKIVAGAANNVLLQEEHGQRLKEAGILYAPDYVINAGGIINVSIEVEGEYDEDKARAKVENIYHALKRVFEISKAEETSTNEASNRLAKERLSQPARS